jgi:hypothetical protein
MLMCCLRLALSAARQRTNPVYRKELPRITVTADDNSVAVMFDFVNPVWTGRRL